MNKVLNISFLISKSIFIIGVFLFTTLTIRRFIGIEFNTMWNGGGLIEIPILDTAISVIGVITFLFSLIYYPILVLFILTFLIVQNKISINKTQAIASIKRHLLLCLLTWIIGIIIFVMSGYLWAYPSNWTG